MTDVIRGDATDVFTAAEMPEVIRGLWADVARRDATIAALTAENAKLRDEVRAWRDGERDKTQAG